MLSNDYIHDPERSTDVECGTTCSNAGSRRILVLRREYRLFVWMTRLVCEPVKELGNVVVMVQMRSIDCLYG